MGNTDRATVAVRIERDIHAEAVLAAELQGITLTELILRGIADQVATLKADPAMRAKAAEAAAAVDAEYEARRRLLADWGTDA